MTILAAVLLACNIEGAGPAQCGTIPVPEVRGGKRMIDLNVVVLPAAKTPELEPLFVFQGGPGQAVTPLADFYARTFAGIREQRDIVLIDQRGTGKSNPMYCNLGDPKGDLFPVANITACRDEFVKRADPKHYTTADFVRDVDDVRAALGYDRINVFGTSYGTRVAAEYVRKYPKRARSMIVKGVVPAAMLHLLTASDDTQRSLDMVVDACRNDVACNSAFPKLAEDAAKVLAARRDDVNVELRGLLHSLGGIRRVPMLIHAAAEGDWKPFEAEIARHRPAYSTELSVGLYLSVVCAEDLWRTSPGEASRIAAFPRDYWYRQVRAACAVWPHGRNDVSKPLRSPVPTLIVSGGFDPVTPPRWGDELAKGLPNSRHVAIPTASHSFAGLAGCVDRIMSKFVIEPDPAKVDESCTAKVKLQEFATK